MDSSSQEDSDRARFVTVSQNLEREKISVVCVYSSLFWPCFHGLIDVPTSPRPIRCELLSGTTCGSFNAIFKVLFADGTVWILKVPANGYLQCWDEPAKEVLISELFTMRLIRRETTIPILEVYTFNTTVENELGYPFILIELK